MTEKNSDQGGSEPCNQAELIHWDILTRVNANFQEILFLVELETGIFFQCIEGPKYDKKHHLIYEKNYLCGTSDKYKQ